MKHFLDPVSQTTKAVRYACNMASTDWRGVENACLCAPIKEMVISSDDLECLSEMYSTPRKIEHVNRCIVYSDRVFYGCLNFTCKNVSNSAILALWGKNLHTVVCGEVQYVMESVIELKPTSGNETKQVKHVIACVKWYEIHPL